MIPFSLHSSSSSSSSSSSIFIDTQFTGVFSWGALGSLTSL